MFNGGGHHVHRRDHDFLRYNEMVRSVRTALKRVFKGSHIILRTTSWGHEHCETLLEPFTFVQQAREAAFGNPWQCVFPTCTRLQQLAVSWD